MRRIERLKFRLGNDRSPPRWRARAKRKDSKLIDVWCNRDEEGGATVYSIFLDRPNTKLDDTEAEPLERYENLEPLAAQAVFNHLLGQ